MLSFCVLVILLGACSGEGDAAQRTGNPPPPFVQRPFPQRNFGASRIPSRAIPVTIRGNEEETPEDGDKSSSSTPKTLDGRGGSIRSLQFFRRVFKHRNSLPARQSHHRMFQTLRLEILRNISDRLDRTTSMFLDPVAGRLVSRGTGSTARSLTTLLRKELDTLLLVAHMGCQYLAGKEFQFVDSWLLFLTTFGNAAVFGRAHITRLSCDAVWIQTLKHGNFMFNNKELEDPGKPVVVLRSSDDNQADKELFKSNIPSRKKPKMPSSSAKGAHETMPAEQTVDGVALGPLGEPGVSHTQSPRPPSAVKKAWGAYPRKALRHFAINFLDDKNKIVSRNYQRMDLG